MAELNRPVDHPVIRQFYSIIRRGVGEELSSRAIIRAIRESGGMIRDSIAFSAISDVRNRVAGETRLRFLNLDQAPNVNRLPESLNPTTAQFSFRVGLNKISGGGPTDYEQIVTVVTDDILTRREIEEMAASFAVPERYGVNFVVRDVQLLGGTRTPGGVVI